MSLDHLEKAYRLLCLAKHATYKGSGLDSSKKLPDGGYTLTFEPVIDNEFFDDIMGKAMDAVRVTLYDTASVLGQNCDKEKLNRWQKKLDRFTISLRKPFSG